MGEFNLPPGCRSSDIPGNRPEDVAFERFHENVDEDIFQNNLTPKEAEEAWRMGLSLVRGRKTK